MFHMSELRAMQSSSGVINSANAVTLGTNAEKRALSTLSLHIRALRSSVNLKKVNAATIRDLYPLPNTNHALERVAGKQAYSSKAGFIRRSGEVNAGISSLLVYVCKGQDVKKLSNKTTLTSSPSPSSAPLSAPTLLPLSCENPRTLNLGYLISQSSGLGLQGDSSPMKIIIEKLITMRLVFDDIWPSHHEQMESQWKEGRKGLLALIAAIVCLTCPTIMLTDVSVGFSDSVALAQPIGQIRQAALLLERFAGENASARLLDKVMTVISGQTVVTPETVEKLKSIIDGEKDPQDWQADLANNVETLWSTAFDVVSNFDPLSWMQTTGTSIQGLVEVGVERFAAFELSTLVALGERWILWTPFVVLPMYWQMTREERSKEDNGVGREAAVVELSEEAKAKAARVRDELERIELKSSLLDLINSLGKLAWQLSGTDQNLTRKQIDEILARLQELNPTSSSDLGGALATPIEPPHTQPTLDVDGEWNLIYVSQASNQSQQTQLPQFLSLDIPGIELSNMRQKLWRKGSRTNVPIIENEGELMMAKNTAQVRLGPLGVVEIAVQGSWENRRNGKAAVVSFNTFSAKPIEVLGSVVRDDLPPLALAIPATLQTSGEWETVYLDNSLRINRGRTGQFYLFRKSQ
eukprot:c24570_g1_i2 orf=564-2477(+)